jgi:hypothetical protein
MTVIRAAAVQLSPVQAVTTPSPAVDAIGAAARAANIEQPVGLEIEEHNYVGI